MPVTVATRCIFKCGARTYDVGNHDRIKWLRKPVIAADNGFANKQRLLGKGIDDGKNRDAGVDGRQDSDFRKIRFSGQHKSSKVSLFRQGKCLRTIGLRLPKEGKGSGKIFDGKPRLLGEPFWRQIVGIAARRSFTDLDESFLDATLEIGVNETQRDAKFLSNATL